MTGSDLCSAFPPKREKADWERRPIRVALEIADRALRAEIAETCEDAEITLAKDADVVVADRPVEAAVPVIALVSGETRRVWPANVRAVVPAGVDATTLAAIVTVVAAGYALLPRKDLESPPHPPHPRERWKEGWGKGEGREGDADPADEPGSALSPREREVLALLAEGASNKEIARALGLSVHTVKFHIATLSEKLGARSRVEAVAIAIRSGLVMA